MEGMPHIRRIFIETDVMNWTEYTIAPLRMVVVKYAPSSFVDSIIALGSCVSNLRIWV